MVRHGESEGNRERRFTTTPDAPLTDLGREQAAQAARRIARLFHPRLVITSPYARARETGEIIAAAMRLPVEVEHGIYERHFGYLRGQPYDAVRDDPTFETEKMWLWRPEGGESYEDVRQRVSVAINEIRGRYPDQELIVVSHGGVMASIWAHLTGAWEGAHMPPNCGIVLIEHEPDRLHPPKIIKDEE